MESLRDIAVVIVAAGRGERAGQAGGPKQYRLIGGKPVIRRTVEAFLAHSRVGAVTVVIHADDDDLLSGALGELAAHVTVVKGGATRQASALAGLAALEQKPPLHVMIHDGARPFVDAEMLDRVIDALAAGSGAIPAMAVSDTIKAVSNGRIVSTLGRRSLYAAQTPQAFPYAAFLEAHRRAASHGRHDFTDDASIAEWVGMPVRIVEGSPENIKITWKRDIDMADQRLAAAAFPDVRTGNGYDVHSFEPGDHVTLCGVRIPHGAKLNGHSDSDVALHALTDALLATCGAGDIGTHFPPSDPQWRGASSSIFLKHAADIIRSANGRIANVDVTLICEAPKIGPHRPAMTAVIGSVLGIANDRVSIKATTNEKLGFIGRNEGIAAIATASVVFRGGL